MERSLTSCHWAGVSLMTVSLPLQETDDSSGLLILPFPSPEKQQSVKSDSDWSNEAGTGAPAVNTPLEKTRRRLFKAAGSPATFKSCVCSFLPLLQPPVCRAEVFLQARWDPPASL